MTKESRRKAALESPAETTTEQPPDSGVSKTTEETPFPMPTATREGHLELAQGALEYRAIAEWITLRRIHKPVAHLFHTAYLAKNGGTDRPLTFVFNGGPGAASAYLHMGALGPQRVVFGDSGSLPVPPTRVVDNAETWLAFTDLVFIDPVGTGFSRALKPEKKGSAGSSSGAEEAKAKPESDDPKENPEFWDVGKDLDSLGEFIRRFLSKHHRWTSPIFVAGESYGGFRVAKMARKLQESHGVGLCGAVLISPAIEVDSLTGTDYDLTYWIELFPSLVAAAFHHGRARNVPDDATLEQVLRTAEAFATGELPRYLVQGTALPETERSALLERMAGLCGLPADLLGRAGGRIASTLFCRELLRDQRRLCGHYDASITTTDPFPDRNSYEGPDPTLFSIDRLFTGAINHQLRTNLGVETDLDYRLLSMDVNTAWKDSESKHVFEKLKGAMDDLRYGMSLNEHMQVFLAHGYFDLVTPYYSSRRLVELMKLTPEQRSRLTTASYRGGHMFYSWDTSRQEFARDSAAFFAAAVGGGPVG
ncbi:MAG: peptidase S10 [Candidatus Eiseniibacteriota bacterium]